jgi:hypothetical protein
MRVFVLGADDPEMRAIEAVLKQQGETVVYAQAGAFRVTMHNAYSSTYVSPALPPGTTEVVCVECSVMGLPYTDLIDHHRDGDPGYEATPEKYVEGSSLGQLLTLLSLDPTDEQRIICAADHCLTHAYKGLCPGVSPEALAAWRSRTRAQHAGISVAAFERKVEKARRQLVEAEKVDVGGTAIAWVGELDGEYGEAGARFNIPFMGTRTMKRRTSVALFGTAPDVTRLWMKTCGLVNVYGAPERGYAGGYSA